MGEVETSFVDKKVLVTGHTGFIGSWLSIWLHQLGAEVYGLADTIPTCPSLFENARLDTIVHSFWGDIRDRHFVEKVIQELQPDYIFHLAAQSLTLLSYYTPRETIATNAFGTLNILEALRLMDQPCAAILITSDKCYENNNENHAFHENCRLGGQDPYSASKAMAELVIQTYHNSYFNKLNHIRIASARAGNIYGGADYSSHRLIPDCSKAWLKHQAVTIRNPDATRPWQFILDPLRGYLLLASHLKTNDLFPGHAFNFGPDESVVFSVKEVVNQYLVNWSVDTNMPIIIEHSEPSANNQEAVYLRLNIDKAKTVLGWKPVVDLSLGLKLTGEFYQLESTNHLDVLEKCRDQIRFYKELLNPIDEKA